MDCFLAADYSKPQQLRVAAVKLCKMTIPGIIGDYHWKNCWEEPSFEDFHAPKIKLTLLIIKILVTFRVRDINGQIE